MKRTPLLAALTAGALLLTAAPTAHGAPGTPSDDLVRKWYANFLGRPLTEDYAASGRGYWVEALERGEDRRRILDSILSSAEYADDTVDGYYSSYLGRDADRDTGSDYWKSGIRADMEPEWVEQNILASPEYATRTGTGEAARIAAWYRVILGRTGTTVVSGGEIAYWEGRLRASNALAVVREIWYSQEAVEKRIRDTYAAFLGRTPTQVGNGEIDYWYDRAFDTRLGLQTDFALTVGYSVGNGPTPPPQTPQPPVVADVAVVDCRESVYDGDRAWTISYTVKNVTTTDRTYDVIFDVRDTGNNLLTQVATSVGPVKPTQTLAATGFGTKRAVGAFKDCVVNKVTARAA